jgi:hypothetical protein
MITVMVLPSSMEKPREGNAVTQVPHDVISIRPQTNNNSPTAKSPIWEMRYAVLQFHTLGIYLQGPGGNRDFVTQFVRVLDQVDRRVWANNTIKRAQGCYYFETSLAPYINDAVAAVIICRNEYVYSALLS